ncbi:MAG: hypothetical protein U9O87_01415 [Verrucomicrobiota bacterium]|nr:hypothetical protein [Verrucomicrobiota bacterium]
MNIDIAILTIVNLDADSDGMSDDWKTQYGEDLLSSADDDGDGTNLQEYTKGTDPTKYLLNLIKGWNLV